MNALDRSLVCHLAFPRLQCCSIRPPLWQPDGVTGRALRRLKPLFADHESASTIALERSPPQRQARLRVTKKPYCPLALKNSPGITDTESRVVISPTCNSTLPRRGRSLPSARAAERRAKFASIIQELQAAGTTSPSGIAAALHARGVPTLAGRRHWYPT